MAQARRRKGRTRKHRRGRQEKGRPLVTLSYGDLGEAARMEQYQYCTIGKPSQRCARQVVTACMTAASEALPVVVNVLRVVQVWDLLRKH